MTQAVPQPPCVLRVGLFHWSLPERQRKPGGVEVVVHRLANALAIRSDTAVTVYSSTPPPPDAIYQHRPVARQPKLLYRFWPMRILFVPLSLNFVRFDQDVLHLHGDDWFFVRRSIPTVRTLHGSALNEARTATSIKRRWSQRLIYLLEKVSARLATVCAAVGPQTQKIYNASKLLDNGVDTFLFCPGQKSVKPRILFIGTWAGRKRGQFMFEQFQSLIRPQIPDAELVMVCDYCPSSPNVLHVVTPDDATLAELYRSAWVFACPSVYEGFGVPYLEAMASGTAVVASQNQGASYVLRDGQLGRIVDDSSFGSALVSLLTDSADRRRLELSGRAAAEEFTWDRIASTHRVLYQETADHWKRS